MKLLDKFGSHKQYSQEQIVQIVPRYKWFLCKNGSHVHMAPRYKWFPCTNGSHVQMVPNINIQTHITTQGVIAGTRFLAPEKPAKVPRNNGYNRMGVLLRAGARSPQCLVPCYTGCNLFAPSSPQCGMQYVCT
jgi:hypothetical protein